MAKQIKVVKCPQCGSNLHTKISEDHYLCGNCNTEYYLDSDDININVNHRIDNTQPTPANTIDKTRLIAIAVVLGIAGLFFIFSLIFPSTSNSNKPTYYTYPEFEMPIVIKDKIYILALTNSSSSYDKGAKNDCLYSFTDISTGKVEKKDKIEGLDRFNSSDIQFTRFSNRKIYIVVNKQKIYEIGDTDFKLTEVTQSMFDKDPLYTSGVAEVDPYMGRSYGECFKVMTNVGMSYYYYPLIKQSYPSDSILKAIRKVELFANAKDSIIYGLLDPSENSDKVQCKLLQIKYKYNGGGPCSEITRRGEPYSFLDNQLRDNPYIISHDNLTPERSYMNPYLVYFDATHLLVMTTATASKQSQLLLQRINNQTGELMWTVPIKTENDRYAYSFDQANHASNKFIIKLDNLDYATIDDDGKNLKYFSLSDL